MPQSSTPNKFHKFTIFFLVTFLIIPALIILVALTKNLAPNKNLAENDSEPTFSLESIDSQILNSDNNALVLDQEKKYSEDLNTLNELENYQVAINSGIEPIVSDSFKNNLAKRLGVSYDAIANQTKEQLHNKINQENTTNNEDSSESTSSDSATNSTASSDSTTTGDSVAKSSESSSLTSEEPIIPVTTDVVKNQSVQGTQDTNLPSIGKRSLPTISGVNVEKLTGVATVSYPIEIPMSFGNLPISLGLNYSSRIIDEMRLNKLENNSGDLKGWKENVSEEKSAPLGLGWNLSAGNSITLDPNTNQYSLSLSGINYKITYNNTNGYQIIPIGKIKVERLTAGAWKITDTNGTVYQFGSVATEDGKWTSNSKDGGLNPNSKSANEYTMTLKGLDYYEDQQYMRCVNQATKWNLSKIIDVHGNTAEYAYEQDVRSNDLDCGGNNLVAITKDIKLTQIRYNYNGSRYLTKVNFNYSDFRGNGKAKRFLNSIDIFSDGLLVSKYTLDYTWSYKNSATKLDKPKGEIFTNEYEYGDAGFRELLLTQITHQGLNGEGSMRPYKFCYKEMSGNYSICRGDDTEQNKNNFSQNDIYLTQVDNGYAGIVTYNYEKVSINDICFVQNNGRTLDRICTADSWNAIWDQNYSRSTLTDFYRVKQILADNGIGQKKQTDYEYLGSTVASGTLQDKFKTEDNKYYSKVSGLQLLGNSSIKTKVTEPDSGKILSYVEEKAFTYNKLDSKDWTDNGYVTNYCFARDPRYGQIYESDVLDRNANIIGFTKNDIQIRYRPNDTISVKNYTGCIDSRSEYASLYEVYQKGSYSEIDGKKSKSEIFYDFEAYGKDNGSGVLIHDASKGYGNVVKTMDYGDPDISGDEKYSYTTYLQNTSPDFSNYSAKNFKNLVSETFTSDQDISDITNLSSKLNQISDSHKFGWTKVNYDERLSSWDPRLTGVRGLVSSKESYVIGKSADDQNSKITLTEKYDYDKFGKPIRTTASNGAISTSYYQEDYQLPICSVTWKTTDLNFIISQSWNSACDQNNSRDTKIVGSYNDFQNFDSMKRGLPTRTRDANYAYTKYDYDEYGRVTRVYAPDKDSGQEESTPAQIAYYYDSVSPMRTRIETRIVTDFSDSYKTQDQFFDGFGNAVQSISYNLSDKDGNYAVVSADYFNGIGQTYKKLAGVPVRDLNPGDNPTLVSESTINSNANLAVKTETEYDFFSRPVKTTVTTGGNYGDPIISTTTVSYDGYTVHTYSNSGNETKVESRGLNAFSTTYLCQTDRNCTSQNGTPLVTQVRANILGKPISTIDPNGITVRSALYNSAGALLSETDVDRGTTNYYYDELARLTEAKDANGNSARTTNYDILNRAIDTETTLNSQVESQLHTNYDSKYIGKADSVKLTKYGTVLQQQEYSYDKRGNVTNSTDNFDLTTIGVGEQKYSFTKSNATSTTGLPLSTTTSLNGSDIDKVNFNYDNSGKITKVVDGLSNSELLNNLVYDYRSQLLGLKFDNNIQASNTYDNSGRIIAKNILNQFGKSQFSQTTTFDPITQLLTKIYTTAPFNNYNYTNEVSYDSSGRISKITGNEYNGNYQFDSINNLQIKQEVATEANSNATNTFFTDQFKISQDPCDNNLNYKNITKYDPSVNSCPYHGAISSNKDGEAHYFLYDKVGNVISEYRENGNLARKYEYNSSNLPTKITDFEDSAKLTKTLEEEYIYTIGGIRIAKLNSVIEQKVGETPKGINNYYSSYSLYLGSYQKDVSNNTNKNVESKSDLTPLKPTLNVSESVTVDTPLAAITRVRENGGTWSKNYSFTNYQGSVVFTLNQNGELLKEFQSSGYLRYFAYGGQITKVNVDNLPRQNSYTGQKLDRGTGLMYYNARYYDPQNGLFLQADPAGDGLNRYTYVGGNPVMMTDPSGKFGVAGAVVGGIFGAVLSGGIDAITQQITTGHVDWGRVAVSAVVGGAEGACMGATAGLATGACMAVGAGVQFAATTVYNVASGQDLGEAVANSAIETTVQTAASVITLGVTRLATPIIEPILKSFTRNARLYGKEILSGIKESRIISAILKREEDEMITVYHGSPYNNHESIIKNGVHGGNFLPTVSSTTETPVAFASGEGLSLGGYVPGTKGGHVYEMSVPKRYLKEVHFEDKDVEIYYALSKEAPFRGPRSGISITNYNGANYIPSKYIKKVTYVAPK